MGERKKDPAVYNLKYKGRAGHFTMWVAAKHKELLVGEKLSFICVGSANRMMGGKQGFSVWSNCFTDTKKHNVILFKKPTGGSTTKLLSGSYDDQKGNFFSHGAKFHTVLWGFITGTKDPKQLVKVSIAFQGTSLGSVWEYLKTDIDGQPCVVIDGKGIYIPPGKNPGYHQPKFYPTTGGVNGFKLTQEQVGLLLPSPYFNNYGDAVDQYLQDQIEVLDQEHQSQAHSHQEDQNPLY